MRGAALLCGALLLLLSAPGARAGATMEEHIVNLKKARAQGKAMPRTASKPRHGVAPDGGCQMEASMEASPVAGGEPTPPPPAEAAAAAAAPPPLPTAPVEAEA